MPPAEEHDNGRRRLAQPPQWVEGEERLLGTLMEWPDTLTLAHELGLQSDDFYRPAHRDIYQLILELKEAGQPHTPTDLWHAAAHDKNRLARIRDAGGAPFLHSLYEARGMAEWARDDIVRLVELGHRRRLMDKALQAHYAAAEESIALADINERLLQFVKDGPNRAADGFAARLLSVRQLLTMRPPPLVIGGVLEDGGLGVLYGAPGSYKSFLALDWACCVACGQEWQGRPVIPGDVLYLAAEGHGGIGQRLWAWTNYFDVPDEELRFRLLPEAVNLTDTAAVAAAREWVAATRPRLVVLDTLARSMLGADENSAQDMGLAVAAADSIRQAGGCAVLLVHHSTKDGVSLRGSGALLGAADTVIEVTAEGPDLTVECRKQKNFAEFAPIKLRRHVVELNGGEATSCILQAADASSATSATQQRHEDVILQEMDATFSENGASGRELRETVKMHPSTFSRTVNSLLKQGRLRNIGTKMRPHYILPGTLKKGAPE